MVNPSDIKNKIKRNQVYLKLKADKEKAKLAKRLSQKKQEQAHPELKEERLAQHPQRTLETAREKDETMVSVEDEEVSINRNG